MKYFYNKGKLIVYENGTITELEPLNSDSPPVEEVKAPKKYNKTPKVAAEKTYKTTRVSHKRTKIDWTDDFIEAMIATVEEEGLDKMIERYKVSKPTFYKYRQKYLKSKKVKLVEDKEEIDDEDEKDDPEVAEFINYWCEGCKKPFRKPKGQKVCPLCNSDKIEGDE